MGGLLADAAGASAAGGAAARQLLSRLSSACDGGAALAKALTGPASEAYLLSLLQGIVASVKAMQVRKMWGVRMHWRKYLPWLLQGVEASVKTMRCGKCGE
eukprot:363375-Chlamydomonas_euryale.AAC.3